MGVSKNSDTPKWKVYNGKLIKMDDLGIPLFLETPIYCRRQNTACCIFEGHASWGQNILQKKCKKIIQTKLWENSELGPEDWLALSRE